MIYTDIDDGLLYTWESRLDESHKYTLSGGYSFSGLFTAPADNLGISCQSLEYYLNIFTAYHSTWPRLPRYYVDLLQTLANTNHPHVLLKVYRLQKGLE